jgi:O-methyltransferase involved in polyketide biosynthesis
MSTDRISPTAYYTAHVWCQNGLSHPALDTHRGAAMFLALRPIMRVGRAFTGGVALEEMLLQRHLLIDHLLSTAIESGRVGQVLEIAAGMSGRGLRFAQKYADRGLVYVEGDLPVMAARKRSRLTAAGLERPGHHVVALDILKDEGPDSLGAATAGLFDRSQGIAVITEGLLSYFDTPATQGLWRRLAAFVAPFKDDLYLSDLHLGAREKARSIEVFLRGLGVFARGRIHTHFTRLSEVAPALAQQGFARTIVHRPADWQARLSLPGTGGLEVVQVIEATTRRSDAIAGM